MKRALVVAVGFAMAGGVAMAQQVVAARSGLVHLVEGQVYLGNEALQSKVGNFPEVKENATLRTQLGRAEVLLTPGVFLRLGENSSFRMITNRLIDTRLEILSGSAVVEADEIVKDTSVTVVLKDATVHFVKKGLYRFDGNPAALRVSDGEASVEAGGQTVVAKEGHSVQLEGQLAVAKFDKEETDSLDRWSRRRGEYLAMVNVSAANSLRKSGNSWLSSGWAYNPFLGMYAYMPCSGSFMSPYGYRLWSPVTVVRIYRPRPAYFPGMGGGGYAGGGWGSMPGAHTSTGYSGAMSSAPSMSAPVSHAPSTAASSAPSAPVSHSSAGATGGGGASRR